MFLRGEVDTLMHTMGRCRLLRSLLVVSLIVADRCELLRGLFCITSWVTGIVVECFGSLRIVLNRF